ncbi:Site-specific recombinase XerD [Ruminococcus sp. YE71]|uniref:tyrosine-type recombinase/integrase n=1 Tax=unclassified Ruminococcus TaxID=2608920 RepID=UPI00087F37ED|nr:MULTISPECIES: tyrosine-type recombinase/integrase [unclassified Ruminococcus]SDA21074.1 Site-specific recombinase XerD [Ruminococcus sp. YE78]SFW33078.1 Site-specific recombinase XerD [Ruminococcus sp. YE71]
MKQKYRDDCPQYLEDFLTYMKVIQDRADRTEEAYYIDLRTFLRYLKIKNRLCDPAVEWGDISIADVPFELIKRFTLNEAHQYLYYLRNDRQNSTATRARKASALKRFFNYLHLKAEPQFRLSENPVENLDLPRVKNKQPRFLTLEQSLQMLASIDSKNRERDYCIICLFLNCGMRLSELVGLNIIDYSEENRTLRLFGKGSKERIVYLNNACIDALNEYLVIRKSVTTEERAMFLSARGTRITRRRVQQIVEEMLKRAGLSNLGITTHKLRHTAATLMYQHGGVDTLVLRDVLGHKSIATTEIYTHLVDDNLRKAAESSPLANVQHDKKKK